MEKLEEYVLVFGICLSVAVWQGMLLTNKDSMATMRAELAETKETVRQLRVSGLFFFFFSFFFVSFGTEMFSVNCSAGQACLHDTQKRAILHWKKTEDLLCAADV